MEPAVIRTQSRASSHVPDSRLTITFPRSDADLDQDEEWFIVEHEGGRRRLRIHDYAELYRTPGLYEALVYDALQCSSPERIADLLRSVLPDWPRDPADLRVFDLGAGNGCVGEVLRNMGVPHLVGLDLLPEARMAARRDRPDVYDDYLVADLCALGDDDRAALRRHRLNCLITVAALGYGDIPPLAFGTAFNLIEPTGWLAMTIKEDFLNDQDASGFARLMQRMIDEGVVEIQAHHRYCHRVSIAGEQLFYVAVVARKCRDIPTAWLADDAAPTAATMPDPDIAANGTDHASMLLGR